MICRNEPPVCGEFSLKRRLSAVTSGVDRQKSPAVTTGSGDDLRSAGRTVRRPDLTMGIVHVIGPELGLVRPGMTVVCCDSHTTALGAFGAIAFGIGTKQVEHVLPPRPCRAPAPRTWR